jgi:hypothetical protein
MENVSDLQLGKAGEYLVCAELILKGYIAFPSEQGLPYDVVADSLGKLIRIQVKTTEKYRASPQRKYYSPSYLFQCRRCGKGGRRSYNDSDFDIMAFVCLQEKIIGYVPIYNVKQTMHFRTKDFVYKTKNDVGRYIEDFTFEKALNDLQNYSRGLLGSDENISR